MFGTLAHGTAMRILSRRTYRFAGLRRAPARLILRLDRGSDGRTRARLLSGLPLAASKAATTSPWMLATR